MKKITPAASMVMLFTSSSALAQAAMPQPAANPGVAQNPGMAQDATQPATDADQPATGGLGDIVITATKKARAEQLQRVPLAITAFDTAQLQNTFATTITDIGRQAPNVRLEPSEPRPASPTSPSAGWASTPASRPTNRPSG